MTTNRPPVLYSFRRCPYAIRARMALRYAGIAVELREVLLRDKPASLLQLSAKGTVPVLQIPDGEVFDESIDIVDWALAQNDPEDWRQAGKAESQTQHNALVTRCDGEFKHWLDRYKYADRYGEEHPGMDAGDFRASAEPFLRELEHRLLENSYLCGDNIGRADIAVLPFIRQFAAVDRRWFDASDYRALREWLERLLEDAVFTAVMRKYPVWIEGTRGIEENWAGP